MVDQRKKEPLFFRKKLTRFGQLWVVGLLDLQARGNMFFLFVNCHPLFFEQRTHGHTYINSPHFHFGSSSLFSHLPPFFWCFLAYQSIIVMPTTELLVVNSAGVSRKISKLLTRFYRYKKQIAGNMDPLPCVTVNATHPALTAPRRSGKWQSCVRVRNSPNPHIPSSSGEGNIHHRSYRWIGS